MKTDVEIIGKNKNSLHSKEVISAISEIVKSINKITLKELYALYLETATLHHVPKRVFSKIVVSLGYVKRRGIGNKVYIEKNQYLNTLIQNNEQIKEFAKSYIQEHGTHGKVVANHLFNAWKQNFRSEEIYSRRRFYAYLQSVGYTKHRGIGNKFFIERNQYSDAPAQIKEQLQAFVKSYIQECGVRGVVKGARLFNAWEQCLESKTISNRQHFYSHLQSIGYIKRTVTDNTIYIYAPNLFTSNTSQDDVLVFVEEFIKSNNIQGRVVAKDLYDAFVLHANLEGKHPIFNGRRVFYKFIESQGYTKKRGSGNKFYISGYKFREGSGT